jgi:6-phosphogluconolactonase
VFVYVGTYTNPPGGKASGIDILSFDPQSGALTPVETATGIANPSYLALAPGNHALYAGERYLYAAGELQEGVVTAFSRDSGTGSLTVLNSQSSHGVDPCYVSLDPTGKYVLVANYTSGSIAALPVSGDGSLEPASSVVQHEGSSIVTGRQEGPHAHMIAPTPDGQAILVTDLGTDAVVIYRLDTESGRLEREGAFLLEPGSGPRHFAFAPNGRYLYVINELSSTLSVFEYDAEKLAFPQLQSVSTLPDYFSGDNSCAHVVVSPDGQFVYGSNRGHDSIAIWSIDDSTGEVSRVDVTPTGGQEPRNFGIDPSGQWLLAANQNSDTIVVFQRDQKAGTVTQVGEPVDVPTPVCIVFAGS